MAAPKGNKYALGRRNPGPRLYTDEENKVQMNRLVRRCLFYADALMTGKIGKKQLKDFQAILPLALKAMDKLHANKQELDHKNLPQQVPIPILAPIFAQNVHIHDGNQENKLVDQANPSGAGGDIGQQNSINNSVVDIPSSV